VFVEVPIGTYTGWNLFNRSFFEDGFCTLQGSFIPFAPTRAERLAAAGVVIPFADGHPRQLTTLTAGPVESLGTTDDCGFSPFADETSTTRDTAFAKVKSRVEGTLMASNILKV